MKDTPFRNVIFVLLGVAALVLKPHYSGSSEFVYAYAGNVSASFAVYFIFRAAADRWKFGRLTSAGIALLVVELFEATNGFGVMSNTFDPFDFVANAVGVGLALAIDRVV